MTLSDMYAEAQPSTFEERRDEVVAIVKSATDLAGADLSLRSLVDEMSHAMDEQQFDTAFDTLVKAIGDTPITSSTPDRRPRTHATTTRRRRIESRIQLRSMTADSL